MLNGLDLFSGIGGISKGLEDYVKPVAYCEIDPFCQAVLLSRMATGDITTARIWDDIRTLSVPPDLREHIDIIYGGFPCQDISCAGLRKGLEGERSGLFFEILRLSQEVKPTFIFLENVPGICSLGGQQVVTEIAEMGYDCRWCVISAASIGALHRRERWFLLAHSNSSGLQKKGAEQQTTGTSRGDFESSSASSKTTVADAPCASGNGQPWRSSATKQKPLCCGEYESVDEWQEAVSSMGKLSHGIPNHVARLRALGNAVVPRQVQEAFEILSGIKNQNERLVGAKDA